MKSLGKSLIGLFVVAFFLAIASSARADSFNWTFTETGGGTYSGGGTLTTGTFSGGQAAITEITGNFDTYNIFGLTTSFTPTPDNILYYPGTPYLDATGLGFELTSGDEVNINYASGTYQVFDSNWGLPFRGDGSFTVTQMTPVSASEPGTLVLLGAGLLMLFALVGLKRQALPV